MIDDAFAKKSQVVEIQRWTTFDVRGYPTKMPKVPKGHTIVCGIQYGGDDNEYLFICETLERIRAAWREDAEGRAIHIQWYHTDAIKLPANA